MLQSIYNVQACHSNKDFALLYLHTYCWRVLNTYLNIVNIGKLKQILNIFCWNRDHPPTNLILKKFKFKQNFIMQYIYVISLNASIHSKILVKLQSLEHIGLHFVITCTNIVDFVLNLYTFLFFRVYSLVWWRHTTNAWKVWTIFRSPTKL